MKLNTIVKALALIAALVFFGSVAHILFFAPDPAPATSVIDGGGAPSDSVPSDPKAQ